MAHRSLLSKNLLGMKFMQRTKEKLDDDKEVKATFGYEVDVDLQNEGKPPVEIWPSEPSYGPCEDLKFGRMSFRGYNIEIETLMAQKLAEKSGKKENETFDEMAVDDDNQNQNQKGRKRKRHRYLRPVD